MQARMRELYNLKMRASSAGRHISGAESIVPEERLAEDGLALLQRALRHPKGPPAEIHLKAESIAAEKLQRLTALPVTTIPADSAAAGRQEILKILARLNIPAGEKILAQLPEAFNLRGAMLLDADTLERLEPDQQRGVRVSALDDLWAQPKARKNHFREALILATKTANAPGIVAEICISDDPAYVTGYVASRALGYLRITTLKTRGDPQGGRIFLYRGARAAVPDCIAYLQNCPVLVDTRIPPPPKWAVWQKKLAEKKDAHLGREIPPLDSAPGAYIVRQGRRLLMLASNNYLDLANDPRVKTAAAAATETYGAGTGGARLTAGSTPVHRLLEEKLAQWKGTESALLFNTGYMANLGVIAALADGDWVIFSDECNHASIIDGCRLSRARVVVYRHNALDDLENKVREYQGSHGLIVSDAVFSMDGSIADWPRLQEIAAKYGLYSLLDEAHANGVIGRTGRGLMEYFGTEQQPDILIGTCSKTLGSEGGFVCGSKLLIDFLLNTARSFIFSTALPAGAAAAALQALEIIQTEPQRVKQLQDNTRFFLDCLRARGLSVASDTAIIPLPAGAENKALAASAALQAEGFYIPAIRYPTVPQGQAILRASLMSAHTPEELRAAAEAVGRALQ